MRQLLFFTIYIFSFELQAQEWVWAEQLGRSYYSQNQDMVVMNEFAPSGDLVVIGTNHTAFGCSDSTGGFYARFDLSGNCIFHQTVAGRPEELKFNDDGSLMLVSNVSNNLVLTKYNVNDQVDWQTVVSSVKASGLALDHQGNSFVIGRISTGGSVLGCLDTVSANCKAILKFNPHGNCLWADTVSENITYNGVCTDNFGNVYVTGGFTGSASIGGFSLETQGGSDVMTAKFDGDGICQWAVRGGGPSPQFPNAFTNEKGNAIAFDNHNGLYVTGVASDSADVGNQILSGSGGSNVLLAKYDLDGNVVWAKNYYGGADQIGLAVNTDELGNAFLTSAFVWNIEVGGVSVDGYDHFDVLVSRHDEEGNTIWTQKAGSFTWNDFATDVSVSNGSVAVSGSCAMNAIFATDTLVSEGNQNFLGLISDQTNVSELSDFSNMQVFPNPTSGIITMNNPKQIAVDIRVLDSLGKQVTRLSSSAPEITLNLDRLSSGIYLLQVFGEHPTMLSTQKLILQKHW